MHLERNTGLEEDSGGQDLASLMLQQRDRTREKREAASKSWAAGSHPRSLSGRSTKALCLGPELGFSHRFPHRGLLRRLAPV